ncbi:MAG: adenylyltransferase/cytidyltransferase family protein [Planctomycetota bacterium]|nr:adenylyltransferase/cytidyltransferase family protein [Planctomycetota bacterium]
MSGVGKVTTEAALAEALEADRAAGRRIVFTNGGFDLLHVGHVRALTAAAALGDVLVVAINDDASVARAKGPGRPVVPAAERAEVVAALAPVDHVLVFADDTVDRLLETLRPHVHAKGRDYDVPTLPERETNERLGIEMAFVGDEKERAATGLARRVARPRPDAVMRLDDVNRTGYVLRGARRHLARHGWLDVAKLATTDEAERVEGTTKRWVNRLLVGGIPLYVKVTRPAERGRSPIVELQNHLALRAVGIRAPEPWLAAEGPVDGTQTGVLVTREAPGVRLDHLLRDGYASASPAERLAMARGVGAAVRALHTARFLHPDLQAWHLLVEGSPADGLDAITFIDLQRVTRAGGRIRKGQAAVGLAALTLSLRPYVDARFEAAAMRTYLGGSLRAARPWMAAIEKRMERIRDRGTFREVGG